MPGLSQQCKMGWLMTNIMLRFCFFIVPNLLGFFFSFRGKATWWSAASEGNYTRWSISRLVPDTIWKLIIGVFKFQLLFWRKKCFICSFYSPFYIWFWLYFRLTINPKRLYWVSGGNSLHSTCWLHVWPHVQTFIGQKFELFLDFWPFYRNLTKYDQLLI